MDMDQERPIEKLLRGAAKDRLSQSGESWPIHPATKRLLQSEVARRYPRNKAEASPARAWSGFWPRFAWAGGICAALALVLWVALPEQSADPARLAMERADERERFTGFPIESDDSKGISNGYGVFYDSLNSADASLDSTAPAKPGSVPLFSTSEASTFGSTESKPLNGAALQDTVDLRRDKVELGAELKEPFARRRLAAAAAPPAAAAPKAATVGDNLGKSLEPARSSAVTSQVTYGYFANSAKESAPDASAGQFAASSLGRFGSPASSPSSAPETSTRQESQPSLGSARIAGSAGALGLEPSPPPLATPAVPVSQVLENFQVNRQGDVVLVVDNDGSVYRGRIQEVPPSTPSETWDELKSVPSGGGNVLQFEEERQKVTGTTRGAEVLRRGVAAGVDRRQSDDLAETQTELATIDANAQTLLNFSVAGTNKTLSRKVEFSGKLFSITNSAAFLNQTAQQQADRPMFQYENQIMGRAMVEGLPPIEVNAAQIPTDEALGTPPGTP